MAYGTRFRFRFDSVYGTTYEVRLQEDGYSGSITDRPLGKAPVIRMQDSDPIRATSLDLTLECRTDGEYVDLYALDPKQFKVEVRYKSGSSWPVVWSGFVATEIYSEPDIAPPYDVHITATDGIGVLKEYDYVPYGAARTVREHLQGLLAQTGLTLDLYSASRLREYGETTADFLDEVLIDLDYMAGKSCYDVLVELLKSMRCILTRHNNYWLIVREVDVQITSAGALTAIMSNKNGTSASYSTTIDVGATIGQMGATGTDLWPVGYLTRRVVPAKNKVVVRAPWNWKNGFPKVSANGWGTSGNASFVSAGGYYTIGTPAVQPATMQGTLAASATMFRFMTNFKVTVKASAKSGAVQGYAVKSQVRILAAWNDTASGTTYYYNPDDGWNDTSASGSWTEITATNPDHDVNAAQEVSLEIPSALMNDPGMLSINVNGQLVEVYDITVTPSSVSGYEDTIVIDNGARGAGETLEIIFGRATTSNIVGVDFTSGIFYTVTGSGGSTTTHIITSFADTNYAGLDIMSLTALARAKEVAAPRIEITGKLDKGGWLMMPPPFVKSHGVWALVSRFDWDMLNEDVDFTAVTLPTASVTVDTETITSIPE